MTDFKKGDKVTWNTPQGTTHGTIVKKITSDTTSDGQKFTASQDDPQYEVKSDKSGETAIHKPDSLNKK